MSRIFLPEHAIWQFANAGDELDDWLPYAEDLVKKWSNQKADEVEFGSKFEIILAAYLLKDELLPGSAIVAFADAVLTQVSMGPVRPQPRPRNSDGQLIRPKKSGRKKEGRALTFRKFHQVKSLIKDGKSATQAYQEVAEKYFKSPETIRRDYERMVKKMKERHKKGTGEFD